jgi:hypothetical protein
MAYGIEIAAIVGAAAAIAGTAVTTVAAVKQSKQQADVAESEAQILDAEATNKQAAADYEEHQFRRRAAILMGKQANIYGASGVDPSSGSPLVLTLDTVRQAELEAQNIKRTGQVGASASAFGANLQRYLADRSKGEIPFQALGGGLTAFGQGASALSNWMKPPPRYYTRGS